MGPDPGGTPSPDTRRPGHKSLQLRQQPVEAPSVGLLGVLFVTVKVFSPATQTLPESVSWQLHFLKYSIHGVGLAGIDDDIVD